MLLRRAPGKPRVLPLDLPAWPLAIWGLWLLAHVRTITNRVADGPRTVRVLVGNPLHWLSDARGWLGLLLLAAGIAAAVLARRLAKPGRPLVALRFPAFAWAAALLGAGVVLSMWRAFGHVTDVASGGFSWRFLAVPRTRLVDDVTTVVLAVGALACLALSFGRVHATRERVPTTTQPSTSSSSTTAVGVASQTRSRGAS